MTEAGHIRSVEALLDATPDLGKYKGDFHLHNKNIYPTDLDAIVEVKGEFLVHEYKKVGAPANTGQEILLEALRAKGFAVIVIHHIGSCFDMNFDKAVFKVPDYMPLKWKGLSEPITEMTVDVAVMNKIKAFHNWWIEQIFESKRRKL